MCVMLVLACVFAVSAFAQIPYDTYTYSYWWDDLASPHAYVPKTIIYPEKTEVGPIEGEGDITVAPNGTIFVADTAHNRVVVYDNNFKYIRSLKGPVEPTETDEGDTFNEPRGVFVHADGRVFIADSKNKRIVVYDKDLNFKHIIPTPVSSSFPEGFLYEPSKLAVDYADRVYVICPTTNMGIIEITMEGEFKNFIGAQKVEISVSSAIWRLLETEEQRARRQTFVPTEFNNIAVDSMGFLYITTNMIDGTNMSNAIDERDKADAKYMPVRRFNPSGIDVLQRSSFFPPAGDIQIWYPPDELFGASAIIDVALGDNGVYSLLDKKRGKIFTYDSEGALLYAFGGLGSQKGLAEVPTGITYRGKDILLLDARTGRITIFERTAYGNQLHSAIEAYNDRQYQKASELWNLVLSENVNLDIAYIGMGKAALLEQNFSEAMRYFRTANNIEYYSKALRGYRKDVIGANYGWMLLIVAVIIAGIYFIAKVISKTNKKRISGGGLGSQISYAFHTCVRPFSGFYELKYEKRGGMKGAIAILIGACAATLLKEYGTGFLFRDYAVEWLDPIEILGGFLLPIGMWCVANWCLTSLMDGEGRMKDIFITVCYALLPLVLLVTVTTIVSNIISLDEAFLTTFLSILSTGWMGLLIFTGMLTIHGYTLTKNIVASLLTILGMGIILFIILLCLDITGMVYGLVVNLIKEMSFR